MLYALVLDVSGARTTGRVKIFGSGRAFESCRAGLNEAAVGCTLVGPAKRAPPVGAANPLPLVKISAVDAEPCVKLPLPLNPDALVTVAPPGTRELRGTNTLFT